MTIACQVEVGVATLAGVILGFSIGIMPSADEWRGIFALTAITCGLVVWMLVVT